MSTFIGPSEEEQSVLIDPQDIDKSFNPYGGLTEERGELDDSFTVKTPS